MYVYGTGGNNKREDVIQMGVTHTHTHTHEYV